MSNSSYDIGVGMAYAQGVRATAQAITMVCTLAGASHAWAGVSDWELSEIHRQSEDDASLRYIEIANEVGGCLFPTSTLDLYDADGELLDTIGLSVTTTCYGAPTYFLLATTEAAAYFGVTRDGNLSAELPAAGQLCFRSSQTNYDCVRWGGVFAPVFDLFGPADTSAIAAAVDGISLHRIDRSHIVAADWEAAEPTPKQPNDGSVWEPPDAGPIYDAGPIPDAGPVPDAAVRSDAGPRPDARSGVSNPDYLDLDPVGGASCGCSTRGRGGAASVCLALLALLGLRRRD